MSKAIRCGMLFDDNVVIVCSKSEHGRTHYADGAPVVKIDG